MAQKKPNLDSVTTINEDGSRYFLHPADVKGRFTFGRRFFGYLLLAIYIALPFIDINGNPSVFLDVAQRRFHFFGLTFLAPDLWLGFFLLTGLGFALFYVTALMGRLWCGWACPYTVFLDHIYRRIERIVDGNSMARRKLDGAPWSPGKIVRRIIKHGLYLIASALLAHVFVSYFVSPAKLLQYMQQSPLHHAKVFGVMLFFTVCLYGAFFWFREQFCIIMCPYGRIQSALTDDDTVIIGYDENRGEPRGKATDSKNGDCIDCRRCVQVCPTGIDIRNGLQMECIGCAACIDACDEIMAKVDRPAGLIRYDSMNGLLGKRRRFIRPRILLYTAFLLVGLSVLGLFLRGVHSAQIEVVRLRGQQFYVADDTIRNQFEMRFVSKRSNPIRIVPEITGLPEDAQVVGLEPVELGPMEEKSRTFFVTIPIDRYEGQSTLTAEGSVDPGDFKVSDQFEFIGPSAYTLQR